MIPLNHFSPGKKKNLKQKIQTLREEDNLNTVVAENEGFTPANRNKTHHLKQKNCKKLE
jgi:hypothetical protein